MELHKNHNVDGLKDHAKKKSIDTSQKVDEAIRTLMKERSRISFNSVATKAGVSKSYLYNNQNFRERIELLRQQQEGLSSPKQVKREMTDASKNVLIAAKNKRIKELEEENKRLKLELSKLRGKIYENY